MGNRRLIFAIIYGIALMLLLGGFLGYMLLRRGNGNTSGTVRDTAESTAATTVPTRTTDGYDAELTIRNDWTGSEEHLNGIWRIPFIIQSDIGYSSSIPPVIDYTVEAFEIAEMTAEEEEMAEYLSMPLNETFTFVQMKFTFWNVYGHDFYFYPNRAVMVVNGEKSYNCREELCQGMGNLYRQRAMKSGEIYFILDDISKREIEDVVLYFPSPTSKADGGGEVLAPETSIHFEITQRIGLSQGG